MEKEEELKLIEKLKELLTNDEINSDEVLDKLCELFKDYGVEIIDEEPYGDYNTILQGTAINELTKIISNKNNTFIDDFTGAATIKQGNFSILLPDGSKGITNAGVYKLLDAITIVFSEDGSKPQSVTLPIDLYMEKCGLKDKKEARKQISKNLTLLRTLPMTFKDNTNKKSEDFVDVNLFDAVGLVKGNICVRFSDSFYKLLKTKYKVMFYPQQLFKMPTNTNSYFILRKITELKNMNVGKKTEDIISVKTLLKVSPFIPTYNEVKKTDRHYKKRIIEPLERDLDACAPTITWEYCKENAEPLTDEEIELSQCNYEFFSKLNIHIFWKDYPNQTERLERRAKKLEELRKKNEKKGGATPQKGGCHTANIFSNPVISRLPGHTKTLIYLIYLIYLTSIAAISYAAA